VNILPLLLKNPIVIENFGLGILSPKLNKTAPLLINTSHAKVVKMVDSTVVAM
jgi:hypothetical protein